jgi:DNA-binding response OmpR family regulator
VNPERGAGDYIFNPFSTRALCARINSYSSALETGGLVQCQDTYKVGASCLLVMPCC